MIRDRFAGAPVGFHGAHALGQFARVRAASSRLTLDLRATLTGRPRKLALILCNCALGCDAQFLMGSLGDLGGTWEIVFFF